MSTMDDEFMNNEYMDVETIDIPLEDGSTQTCAIMDYFEFDGMNYIMLSPMEDDDTIGEDLYCYRYREDGEDIILDYIADDEELENVSRAYEAMLDELEEDENL